MGLVETPIFGFRPPTFFELRFYGKNVRRTRLAASIDQKSQKVGR
jgi:hypothetical protein